MYPPVRACSCTKIKDNLFAGLRCYQMHLIRPVSQTNGQIWHVFGLYALDTPGTQNVLFVDTSNQHQSIVTVGLAG